MEDEMESIAAEEAGAEGAEGAPEAAEGGSEAGQEAEATPQSEGILEKEDASWDLSDAEEFGVPEENRKSFEAACKKAGLTKDQAAAVYGWHREYAGAAQKAVQQQEAATVRAWQDEIAADPEIGGAHWKQTVADARKALDAFDDDGSLRRLLRQMKADYHPAVVRTIARVGRAMAEDRIITGGSGKGHDSRPLEERLWKPMDD